MFWNKAEKKSSEPVDIQSGIELLSGQIEAAKQILTKRPIQSKDYQAWNDRTGSYLIRIYGERSPNIDTIIEASGTSPVWLFMPDDVAERHTASALENKLQMLKGCVVALKRKAKESQIS